MRKHKEEERARIRAAEEAARAAVLALENEETGNLPKRRKICRNP